MRKLKIQYRRFFRTRTISVDVPETWKELTSVQFIAAVKLWMGDIAEDKFLCDIFNLPISAIKGLESYQRFSMLQMIEFLQNMKLPYNNFFMPVIGNKRYGKFYAPGERLKGCSLQQFMTADTYFQLFIINQDKTEYLDMFVASLYLAKNQRYVDLELDNKSLRLVDIDANIAAQSHVNKDTKYAIFLNFLLIKVWLSKAYQQLFPSSGDDEKQYTNKPALKPTAWLDIFDAFIGDNVPDMKKYQAMPATDAFRIMNKRIRESKKDAR